MKKYTLIGFYSNTGLRYVTHLTAESPDHCVSQVAEMYPDEDIDVVSVIEGHHDDLLEGDYLESTADRRVNG